MNHIFKTGRLGLSTMEIENERKELFQAMCRRRGLDPDDRSSKTGTGRFYTPSELHREQVLWAMSMANTVLCYHGTKDDWGKHALTYQSHELWQHDGRGLTRKFGYNKVQNEAYALTETETDMIWKAQKERMVKATTVPGVVDDTEGTLNGVRW